ncbi:hypothetical protein EDD85DRAFT_785127 [Armillaria nabsnona]|nr:hypothetical protein EDD85DRAFT_785127 [Armillaria nabsnona]
MFTLVAEFQSRYQMCLTAISGLLVHPINLTTKNQSPQRFQPLIPGKDVVNVTDPPSYLQATSSASTGSSVQPEAETAKTTFSKAKVVGGASVATLVFAIIILVIRIVILKHNQPESSSSSFVPPSLPPTLPDTSTPFPPEPSSTIDLPPTYS